MPNRFAINISPDDAATLLDFTSLSSLESSFRSGVPPRVDALDGMLYAGYMVEGENRTKVIYGFLAHEGAIVRTQMLALQDMQQIYQWNPILLGVEKKIPSIMPEMDIGMLENTLRFTHQADPASPVFEEYVTTQSLLLGRYGDSGRYLALAPGRKLIPAVENRIRAQLTKR